jgi:hypothetical protein
MAVAQATLDALSLPPREAIAFFAQKTNATTQHWTDVWRTGHSRSFMVAGAASEDLVADFRAEITKALEQGTTLAEFRQGFDQIVARHGWAYNGGRGWRTRLIYETNLSTAYAAGRYAQMTEPDTLAAFPFWQYVHNDGPNPRLQHRAWNGLVLRADDPFWATHYPPNGWRCGCRVRALTARQLGRQGKTGPDTAPAIETRPWTNPRTGATSDVPIGIDPGFDYNPGQAWQGGGLPAIPTDARFTPPEGFPPRPLPIPAARPAAASAPRPPAAASDDVLPIGRTGAADAPDTPLPPEPPAEEAARLRAQLRRLGGAAAAEAGGASPLAELRRLAGLASAERTRLLARLSELRGARAARDAQRDSLATLRRKVAEAGG